MFPTEIFTGHRPATPKTSEGTRANPQQERGTAEGNPIPTSQSPTGGDIGSRYSQVSPTWLESSQPSSLFDVLGGIGHTATSPMPETLRLGLRRCSGKLRPWCPPCPILRATRLPECAPQPGVSRSGRGSAGTASPAGIETWTQQSRLGGVDVAQKHDGRAMLTVIPKSAGFRWRALAKGPLPGRWVFPR